MKTNPQVLHIVRGDDAEYEITLFNNNAAFPLQLGTKLFVTGKYDASDTDVLAIFEASTENGQVVIPDPTQNSCVLTLPGASTFGAKVGPAVFDVRGVLPNGRTITFEQGLLVIDSEITDSTL